MTLEEAKNKVAKDFYDMPNWRSLREDGRDWRVYEDAHDSVAELFQSELERLQGEKKELREALEGMVKYWQWAINDPQFHEYKIANSLLERIK